MRNLNYITCIELNEFTLIKNSKKLITRSRLNRITNSVDSDYQTYLNNFNTIHNIAPSTYTNMQSKSLQRCYTSSTQALVTLKEKILAAQTIEFQNTCPYCLVRTVSTMDHYIPQTPYPVYSVLANNLLPCCSTCNSMKNETWKENGQRAFIHFYNDNILNNQFIQGTLSFTGALPTISFSLVKPRTMTLDNYSIIQNHFRLLRLESIYCLSVPRVISDIKIDVEALRRTFPATLSLLDIQRFLLEKSNALKLLYGVNYWKSIAIELLANSNPFLTSL